LNPPYILAEIRGIGLANNDQIDGLRRNLALSAAADGRVFDRHPENEVAELIDNQRGKLRIEVMGLTLRPFVRDQLERIEKKDSAHLRLLVQDPGHATFASVCDQESRDQRRMVEEALTTTKQVLEANHSRGDGKSWIAEVRWFSEFPTLTITRVGGVLYARPRFMREAHQGRVFFERYIVEEGAPFEIHAGHFLAAWDAAYAPTLDDCENLASDHSLQLQSRAVSAEDTEAPRRL